MNQTDGAQHFYDSSAQRFSQYYLAYAQAHHTDFAVLDSDLDNLLHVLALCVRFKNWDSVIHLTQTLDIFLDTRGYWKELRFWLEQILNHSERIEDPTVQLDLLTSLASIVSSQGDRVQAERFYQEAINLASRIGDGTRLGSAYIGLSSVYINQGRSDEAQACLRQALGLAQQTEDRRRESFIRFFLEADHLVEATAEASPGVLEMVSQIVKGFRQTGGFGPALRGWYYLARGDHSKARRHYLNALGKAKQQGDAQGTAFVLYQLGMIAALEDDFGAALAYYRQSESIAIRMGDCTGLTLLSSSIGMAYLWQEQFGLALPYLERAVLLARISGDREQLAEYLCWLGHAVANTGDLERAKEVLGESLDLFTQLRSAEAQKVSEALVRLRAVADQNGD